MIRSQVATSPFRQIPILLFPLMALIGSIYLYDLFHTNTISSFTTGFFYLIPSSILAISAFYIPSLRKIAILALIATLCGFLRTMQINHSYESFPFTSEPVTIHGLVLNKTKTQHAYMSQCITIALTSIKNQTTQFSTNHSMQLYTAPHNNIEVGDTIEINKIKLKKPNNADFWRYLIKEGILSTIFIKQFDYTILNHPNYSFRRWFFNYKNNLLNAFQKQLKPSTFNLFASLFLGVKNKKALELINKQFKYWGILHYLARSGLHLAVVITIYEAAFRLIPFSLLIKHIILLLLGGIYFLLSWSSISFIRAFIMFFCYKLFALVNIPTHFLHILIITCCIILLINPIQLFFLDFQLSFCLTFALGWLNLYRTD